MTFKRIGIAALALGLLAGGTVLAEKFYVAVEGAEVVDDTDPIMNTTLRKMKLDEQVDAQADAKKEQKARAASRSYVKVKLADGTEGFMLESALSPQTSAQRGGDASVRASSGAESAGAAASGFTGKIEGDMCAKDPEFKTGIAKIDALEKFVNRQMRGSPDGSYEAGSDNNLKSNAKAFVADGGLRK